jgi:transcriptional regulator PpsR
VNAVSPPLRSLGDLDAESASMLVAAAADIVFIIDPAGIVRDATCQTENLAAELAAEPGWLGRPWRDLVTPDSRDKVDQLLAAAAPGPPKWRHVNLIGRAGTDVPIMCAAVRVGAAGRTIVFGRDLRPVSVLQQRLVSTQQSLERDYLRYRNVETRYRLLLQTAADAVVILEARSGEVVEANAAARRLLGLRAGASAGGKLRDAFAADSAAEVEAMLADVRRSGRPGEVPATLKGAATAGSAAGRLRVHASLFREEQAAFLLVRITLPVADPAGERLSKDRSALLGIVEHVPDAIVVSDRAGHVIAANAAFLDLAQLASAEQARGEALDRWVGRPGIDLSVLVGHLQRHGSIRLFATTMRGQHGAPADVEISAVAVGDGEERQLGFVIRDVGRRIGVSEATPLLRPLSMHQVTALIGRVPLRELVRESSDVIERLCIEAALELTGDNRASAAQMLGLSRQSLYVKMRRHGLGDLTEAEEGT